jgi:hypothetical protein
MDASSCPIESRHLSLLQNVAESAKQKADRIFSITLSCRAGHERCSNGKRSGKRNERRSSLVQTIDLAPTLLQYFGLDIPVDMQGKDLRKTIESDQPLRQAGNTLLYNYTLMPTHMRSRFSVAELQEISLQEPFSFTKGVPTMNDENSGRRFQGIPCIWHIIV